MLLDDRQPAAAEQEAAAVLARDSGSAEAHYLAGVAETARGDARKAEKSFEEVVRINPRVAAAHVQLAKLRGFRTVNVVRRESAVASVTAQGGDVVLVDGDDLAERVKAATNGSPVKLGIDAVGGKATMRLAQTLVEGASIVNYGALSGEPCIVTPRELIFKDVTLKGFWLARWFRTTPQSRQLALLTELAGLIAAGKLSTPIQATYDVAQIKEAVVAAAAGERQGKILITPSH